MQCGLLSLSVTADRDWVYENLVIPFRTACPITFTAAVQDDPWPNTSYSFDWTIEAPADRPGAAFTLVSGAGTAQVSYTAPDRPAYSPSRLPYIVHCTATGDQFGNQGEYSIEIDVRLLADVDDSGCTDAVDRQIIRDVEDGVITDPVLVHASDVNCDGAADATDRQIALFVEQDVDGHGSCISP